MFHWRMQFRLIAKFRMMKMRHNYPTLSKYDENETQLSKFSMFPFFNVESGIMCLNRISVTEWSEQVLDSSSDGHLR